MNQPSGDAVIESSGPEIQPDVAAGQTPSDSSLTDLFGLHGGRVLAAEAELGDGHVVQDDVEVFGPLEQLPADQHGNLQERVREEDLSVRSIKVIIKNSEILHLYRAAGPVRTSDWSPEPNGAQSLKQTVKLSGYQWHQDPSLP